MLLTSWVGLAVLALFVLPVLWLVISAIAACILAGRSGSPRALAMLVCLIVPSTPLWAQSGSSYACNEEETVCARLLQACDAGSPTTIRVYNYSGAEIRVGVGSFYANSFPVGPYVQPGQSVDFSQTLNGFSNVCDYHTVSLEVQGQWQSTGIVFNTRHGEPTTGNCLGTNCNNPVEGGGGDNGGGTTGGGNGGDGGGGGGLTGAHWCENEFLHGGCTRSIDHMQDSALLKWWKKLTVPCECMIYETLQRLNTLLTWGPLGMVQTIVSMFDPNQNQPEETLPYIDVAMPYVQAEQPGQGTYGNAKLRADDAFHYVRLDINPFKDVPAFVWLRQLLGIGVWIGFIFFVWRIIIPRMTF